MPGPHVTAEEAADELGRKKSWLHEQWPRLCRERGMPPPLHGGAAPVVWNRAQFYAWLDRDLPKDQRLAAQAYRAAAAAAAGAPHASKAQAETADWQARVDQQFGGSQ